MGESKFNLSGSSFNAPVQIGDKGTMHIHNAQSEASKEELQPLLRSLVDRRFGEGASAQKLADSVNERLGLNTSMGLGRNTVNNWLHQPGARPKEWWHACAMALVVCDNTEETDRLLAAAKHVSLVEKKVELERRSPATGIDSDNIDAIVLREWIA